MQHSDLRGKRKSGKKVGVREGVGAWGSFANLETAQAKFVSGGILLNFTSARTVEVLHGQSGLEYQNQIFFELDLKKFVFSMITMNTHADFARESTVKDVIYELLYLELFLKEFVLTGFHCTWIRYLWYLNS